MEKLQNRACITSNWCREYACSQSGVPTSNAPVLCGSSKVMTRFQLQWLQLASAGLGQCFSFVACSGAAPATQDTRLQVRISRPTFPFPKKRRVAEEDAITKLPRNSEHSEHSVRATELGQSSHDMTSDSEPEPRSLRKISGASGAAEPKSR